MNGENVGESALVGTEKKLVRFRQLLGRTYIFKTKSTLNKTLTRP